MHNTDFINLFTLAPGYSREEWTSVKFTLGLDFPNVRTPKLH